MKTQNSNEKWAEVKNKALETWDKLTEEDLAHKIKSHRQLVTLIAATYGISRTQAKREIEMFIQKHPMVAEYFESVTNQIGKIKESVFEVTRNGKEKAENAIKEKPLFSLVVALIAGMCLGRMSKSK